MANRHFGKLSDVWKHAALAEVLEREAPLRYAETHAGSGAYPIVHDGERQFGILRFLDVAARFEVLARSRYRAVAASCLSDRSLLSRLRAVGYDRARRCQLLPAVRSGLRQYRRSSPLGPRAELARLRGCGG